MHEGVDIACMEVQNPCMALKSDRKPPKVQRGLSLSQELKQAIQREADKYADTNWNDVAEKALAKVFLPSENLHKKTENGTSDTSETHREEGVFDDYPIDSAEGRGETADGAGL